MTEAEQRERAQRRVNEYRRRFSAYGDNALLFAYHAALPVALTPELRHLIRINFFLDPQDESANDWQPLPYWIEFDFLVSPLCHQVDEGLYEIEPVVRELLLKKLVTTYRDRERVREIATLLWQYIVNYAPWEDRIGFERAQQLTALNFLAPEKALNWLEYAEAEAVVGKGVEREWYVVMRQGVEKQTRIINTLKKRGNTSIASSNEQRSYSELEKEYDFLTEEIQFLRQRERNDDLSPRERFRLKKQIEETEAEREQIRQQLQAPSRLEKERDIASSNEQRSYSELEKEYDFLTEKIQFLRQKEINDDLRPMERFRLKKQIQEAEAERKQIEQQLKAPSTLEKERDIAGSEEQKRYSKLQKEYDFFTEEIQFLRQTERTYELIPRERYRLKKQIEEAEAEREQIGQQLKGLENTSPSSGKDLYRTLLRLGYRQQTRLFRRVIESESAAALLIHGLPDYGQRWLLNRLVVQYVPYLLTGKIVTVNVGRKFLRHDVSPLWRELARRVGLWGKQSSPLEIAERVYQIWQTQNVLLIFHEVETMPENCLSELIQDFWLPLVSKVQERSSQASKFKLLMFLVDYEGATEKWNLPFVEKLDASWEQQKLIKLPMITKFSEDDLYDWIETEYDKLPAVLTAQVDNTVQTILASSDNGIPELAIEEICDRCGVDWYEESEKWVKL